MCLLSDILAFLCINNMTMQMKTITWDDCIGHPDNIFDLSHSPFANQVVTLGSNIVASLTKALVSAIRKTIKMRKY